ncbi:MAG: hypothetical protein QF797_02595 [Alphaproteobacteria bacterium]|jgi:enamine deaminase RidA (YjgF/YER057c/UK114 family)|nr:hypothetical protein [Rhodospirillaceae bacterium]MDP6404075.1 hypothetical protein [Alphaproteobacteria bacterium]MDP6624418.1 hypothetical protein [Alphaproteobacteria bacterium]|tara:strand:- start:206 stop:460 length:255 start_codon:yes stop_codon:yes gene_type:complete
MNLHERAQQAAQEMAESLAVTPGEEQTRLCVEIVERALIRAVLKERDRCISVTASHARTETTNKISDDIRAKEIALITNLSAMR